MKNQKSLGNKGFSLVELIVVIAIMAILVGLLAPQFMKYVGKSRQSTDESNREILYSAVSTTISDPDVVMPTIPATGLIFDIVKDAASGSYGAPSATYTALPTTANSFRLILEEAIGKNGTAAASLVKWPNVKGSSAGYKVTIMPSGTGYTATVVLY